MEEKIEQLVFTGEIDSIRPTANKIGRATRIDDALGRYVEFAKASFPRGMSLEEMRVAVDVANGAAYKSTPCVLRELGADVVVAHNQPNGMNINDGCGSTHPEEIQRIVEVSGADVGITHDGDADRVLLCDENGEIVDGDEILAIASLDFLGAGRLEQNTVVATVMSNFGLDETLAAKGGKVIRTKVGDRYVIEEMVQRKLNLGGEQSGHIIFRDFTTLPEKISAGPAQFGGEGKTAALGAFDRDEAGKRSGERTFRQRPGASALFRHGAENSFADRRP